MEKILFISPSTLDRKSLILTLVLTLIGVIFGLCFYLHLTKGMTFWAVWGIATLIYIILFVFGTICTPHKYILTNSHLIIKRHIKDIAIPLQKIENIRLMTVDDKKGMQSNLGMSYFGTFGYYKSSLHKKLIVFARRYDNRTLIITDQKKYVIAPDDLQLVEATAQQIGQPQADQADDQTTTVTPARQWRKLLPAAIIVITTAVVAIFLYLEYKDPKVEFDSNIFRLKGGVYGVTIPLNEVSRVDTIAWHEMPAISYKTNGFSFSGVSRGHFKTTDGDNVRLSIRNGVSPVIRIIDNNGVTFYINRKDPAETIRIFNKFSTKIFLNF